MGKTWTVIGRPGYLGGKKQEMETMWDNLYGKGNWRISWIAKTGERLSYEKIIQIYTASYVEYFKKNVSEAEYLTNNFSYGYDLDFQSKEEAFDMYALYEKPGRRNQFHQVAFNIALERILNKPFKGDKPIQIRDSKPGTPEEQRPLGWKWNPGLIRCICPELIPSEVKLEYVWWNEGSIEDLYQRSKVVEIAT